jgi:hypothetical protein
LTNSEQLITIWSSVSLEVLLQFGACTAELVAVLVCRAGRFKPTYVAKTKTLLNRGMDDAKVSDFCNGRAQLTAGFAV